MPELPEVETTVRELRKKVLGRAFFDVWSDFPKMIYLCRSCRGKEKKPKKLEQFKKEIKGKKIEKILRRGKNIIFELSDNKILLIHQRLTGHLLFGKWKLRKNTWEPPSGPLSERVNSYLHLLFIFGDGQMLALSDLRKFAKVKLLDKKEFKQELTSLGPEPLERSFTFKKFEEILKEKKGKVKQVLMNQKVIVGIGNIYSDEILFASKVSPQKKVSELKEIEMRKIYKNIKKILRKAIFLQGESFADYRIPSGKRGSFDKERKVYRREGEKCFYCGTIIKRIKLSGRSAHFCPRCQKL